MDAMKKKNTRGPLPPTPQGQGHWSDHGDWDGEQRGRTV